MKRKNQKSNISAGEDIEKMWGIAKSLIPVAVIITILGIGIAALFAFK